jgi:hypothetical protein
MPQSWLLEGRVEVPSNSPDKVQFAREGLERLVRSQHAVDLSWDGARLHFKSRPRSELFWHLLGEDFRFGWNIPCRPFSNVHTGEIRVTGDDAKVIVEYRLSYQVEWSATMIIPLFLVSALNLHYSTIFGFPSCQSKSALEQYLKFSTMRGITESAERYIDAMQVQ